MLEKSEIHDLNFHFMNLEKEKQNRPKVVEERKSEGAETNEIENKH